MVSNICMKYIGHMGYNLMFFMMIYKMKLNDNKKVTNIHPSKV